MQCEKLATIVLCRTNVAQPSFRRKQLSTSAEMQQQFLALYGVIIQSVIQSLFNEDFIIISFHYALFAKQLIKTEIADLCTVQEIS